MEFSRLVEVEVPDYLRSLPTMQERFSAFDHLDVTEVGDGNLNYVYLVTNRQRPDETVVLKQAVPYLRVAGEAWPLTRHRMNIEIAALQHFRRLCPEHVPEVFHADQGRSLVVMQRLRQHRILRGALLDGELFTHAVQHLSSFMARSLFFSSDLYLTPQMKRQAMQQFINIELCKISEDLIFTHPYDDSPTNSYNPALPRAAIDRIQRNTELRSVIGELKFAFMTRGEALLHGDLHIGSVMVSADETYVIDPEFAFYGPMGFDVGILLANFLLAWCGQRERGAIAAPVLERWLLDSTEQCWEGFVQQFTALWRQHEAREGFIGCDLDGNSHEAFRAVFMRRLLTDTLGFAGCEMVRRVLGMAKVADIAGIESLSSRAVAEAAALRIAERLLLERGTVTSIQQVLGWLDA
jgi:5-methylthioribose kinase